MSNAKDWAYLPHSRIWVDPTQVSWVQWERHEHDRGFDATPRFTVSWSLRVYMKGTTTASMVLHNKSEYQLMMFLLGLPKEPRDAEAAETP